MKWEISENLTRRELLPFVEAISLFLDYANSKSEIDAEQYNKLRGDYLDAHEIVVQRYGPTTSTWLERVCESLSVYPESEERQAAYYQYLGLR